MISRVWHGYTTSERADEYENLLRTVILPGIQSRGIPGYRGVYLARRNEGAETQFITAMFFDSMDAVRAFAGDDPNVAVVHPAARPLLTRYDQHASHFDVVAALGEVHSALGG